MLEKVQKHVEKVTLSNPLGRVHSAAIAQFSLFPSGPKKSPKLWPKALQMEAQCFQKPLRRGSQKSIKKHAFLTMFAAKRMAKSASKSSNM